MGSRRKLVLASLLSLMMALAFVVGLVPSYTVLNATAGSGSGGRVDMVDLLNAALDLKAAAPASAIAVTKPTTGAHYMAPEDTLSAPLFLAAEADGDDAPVVYGVDGEWTSADDSTWTVYSEAVGAAPYSTAIDMKDLFTAGTLADVAVAHMVYGFYNAVVETPGDADYALINAAVRSTGVYEDFWFGEPITSAEFYLTMADANADADKNTVPDDIDSVAPGSIWLATYELSPGVFRSGVVANLQGPAKINGDTITVSPDDTYTVIAPSTDALADVLEDDESAFLLVSVSADLEGAIDMVGDSSDPADIADWAADALAAAPLGGVAPDAAFLSVSLVAATADSYREIEELPAGTGVTILARDLNPPAKRDFGMWSLSTDVQAGDDGLYFSNDPEDEDWTFQGMATYDSLAEAYSVYVTDLSVFAPFVSTLLIDGIEPSVGEVGQQTAAAISGNFGYNTDLTLAETLDAFEVYFLYEGGVAQAEITGGLDVSNKAGVQLLPILTPAFANPITASVRIYDTAVDPMGGVFATVSFEFSTFYTLTTDVSPEGSGTVTVNPSGSSFPAGTDVELTAEAEPGYEFANWSGDIGDADADDPTITINMDADKAVTANFTELPRYSLSVSADPEEGGTASFAPAQPDGGFLAGSVVNLIADPAEGYTFAGWTGDTANVADPSDPTTTIVMNADADVVATFEVSVAERQLTVLVQPAGAGSVSPAGGSFALNSTVEINATANTGYAFAYWIGDVEGDVDDPSNSVVMDENKTITAVFTATSTFALTLNVFPVGAGTIVADPEGPYAAGDVVTLTATPASSFEFDGWTGNVDSPFSNPTTITMNANQTVTANFSAIDDDPIITVVEPNEAWLFGGIRAVINGDNFAAGATVTIDGMNATVIEVTANAITVNIPPLADTGEGSEQSFAVNVTVTNPAGNAETKIIGTTATLTNGFTYKRYEEELGVTTTAFFVEPGASPYSLAIQDDPTAALLALPTATSVPGYAYGLARVSKNAAAVLANLIDPILTDADPVTGKIENIWEFAIHLYNTQPLSVDYNTQPLLAEIDAWSYPRNGASAVLTFPTGDAGLTALDVRSGLTMWGLDTGFNYAAPVSESNPFVIDNTPPLEAKYQSTLYANEVTPNVAAATADGTAITAVAARLYDFSAFSLRGGVADLPADIKEGVRLDDEFGEGEGPFCGGTPGQIIAPNGGLAWVKVAFGEYGTAAAPVDKAYDAADVRGATVSNPGENEFLIAFTSPEFPDPTKTGDGNSLPVDIAIYLNNDLTTPVVVLYDAWVYQDELKPVVQWQKILLTLLGLGAAVIGLAAGGDSGGGGGGPCFIATAAYGTPMAADIDTLRAFRDAYLLDNAIGTAFVDTYYRVSPFIADLIARSPFLMGLVRVALMPVIFLAKTPALTMALISMLAMTAVARRIKRRARQ